MNCCFWCISSKAQIKKYCNTAKISRKFDVMKQCWNRIPCVKIQLSAPKVIQWNLVSSSVVHFRDLGRDTHLIYGLLLLILRVKITDEIYSFCK